jgi:hypothetical protein
MRLAIRLTGSGKASRVMTPTGLATKRQRLAGYSLGDVVADLSGTAGSPVPLALEQVVSDRLLDPGSFRSHA